jgi:CHAT domain-containing protein
LIEERNIVVLPAPHLLRQLLVGGDADAPANGLNTPLLIGAVEFGDAPGPVSVTQTDVSADGQRHRSAERRAGRGDFVFGPLPETGREIEAIRAVYEQVFGQRALVVRGAEATKELFRTEAPRHRWVHVATHGFFAPESVRSAFAPEEVDPRPELVRFADMIRGINPGLLSGIALAGANRDAVGQESGDDGILTALEVEGLDLGQVDLVVLSACETGLGRVAGGEGVLGLQRAFHSAGAKTAVTSLWKVDDTATQLLMTEFYTNLWQKKLGKLDALRRAQLRMLREYDPKQMKFVSRGLHRPARESLGTERGSPFYWAGFVLSGDWR